MKLYEYEGKKVRIHTTPGGIMGDVFEGIAEDYTEPSDNYNGIASIIVNDVDIFENEIIKIEVLE